MDVRAFAAEDLVDTVHLWPGQRSGRARPGDWSYDAVVGACGTIFEGPGLRSEMPGDTGGLCHHVCDSRADHGHHGR